MAVAAEPGQGVEPSLERARELALEGNVVPVVMRLVDDCETPVSAFLKLRDGTPCFLLESAEQGRVGRYSFLGFRPREILRWTPESDDDPYAAARALVERHRLAGGEGAMPPFPGARRGPSATPWSGPSRRWPIRLPIRLASRTWRSWCASSCSRSTICAGSS